MEAKRNEFDQYVHNYVPKPETIEAAHITSENVDALAMWCGGDKKTPLGKSGYDVVNNKEKSQLIVPSTLVDPIVGEVGDFLVKDLDTGKFYIQDKVSFLKKYIPERTHIETEESDVEKDQSLYPDPGIEEEFNESDGKDW